MSKFREDLFMQIYMRAPTDEDRARLIGVKAALGLSSNDEFWGVTIALDHYDRSIRAGRAATVQEVKALLSELKAIPERAGPIAEATARKAVAKIIEDASNKIAQATGEKSITTADRISKRQWINAMIAGSLVGATLILLGVGATYLVLDKQGICAEPPFTTKNGERVCFLAP